MNYKGLFFLLLLIGITERAFAQSATYHLQFDETPLEKIFEYLESNHKVLFSYRPQDIKAVDCTIHLQTSSLEKVMQQLLQSTALAFEIVDQNYVLIKAKPKQDQIPSLTKSQKTYTVCGKVKDVYTNEVLAFANVRLKGSNIGVSTDAKGYFELTSSFAETDQLSISYVGYQTKTLQWRTLHRKSCPTIPMDYPSYDEEFIVVTDYLSDGVDLVENGAVTRLDLTRVGSLPGQVEPDVLGVAQFLPGISSPGGKAADIYIRGGTPDQNLMIWESIPIYHTAHYFGMISAFNPFIIEEMNVYRGGFGAAYGGRLAGVIELYSGDERSQRNYWGAGSNMT
ncbi:MAG: carboxypeptidase-like regulatory domain-containing protein, partial [Bacteroidota bacterium]